MNDKLVIADLIGASLRAALSAGVELLKLSEEELVSEGYAASDEATEIIVGAQWLHATGAHRVLISRGSSAAVLIDGATEMRAVELGEELDAVITSALAGTHHKYLGQGPVTATTFHYGNVLVTPMNELLTHAERPSPGATPSTRSTTSTPTSPRSWSSSTARREAGRGCVSLSLRRSAAV